MSGEAPLAPEPSPEVDGVLPLNGRFVRDAELAAEFAVELADDGVRLAVADGTLGPLVRPVDPLDGSAPAGVASKVNVVTVTTARTAIADLPRRLADWRRRAGPSPREKRENTK